MVQFIYLESISGNMIKVNRYKSILISIMCILLSLFVLGCWDYSGYTGDYPELFSVAIDSIPNAKGYMNGEIAHEPVLCFIEEDNYGRKLFCYTDEDHNDSDDVSIYLLICQAADDGYAYYYKDVNFAVSYISEYPQRVHLGGSGCVSWIDNPLTDFSDDVIAELKEKNDWDIELDMDKCVKVKIVRKKTN